MTDSSTDAETVYEQVRDMEKPRFDSLCSRYDTVRTALLDHPDEYDTWDAAVTTLVTAEAVSTYIQKEQNCGMTERTAAETLNAMAEAGILSKQGQRYDTGPYTRDVDAAVAKAIRHRRLGIDDTDERQVRSASEELRELDGQLL